MVEVVEGDCLGVMAGMEPCSVDAVVTDPPYGLEFMGKEWDRFSGNVTDREFKGFVLPSNRTRNVKCPECGLWIYDHEGRACGCGGVRRAQMQAFEAFSFAWAAAALRVAKPGAHLVAFGGTRTYHRLASAMEDAGWEIRDCLMWVYGSGFPKSLNVQQAINKAARGCPQGGADPESPNHGKFKGGCTDESPDGRGFGAGAGAFMREQGVTRGEDDGPWHGWGTALKPAYEPIILARKPLEGTVAANVQKWGVGALNIDGCRVGYENEEDEARAFPGGQTTSHGSGSLAGPGAAQAATRSVFVPRRTSKGRWPANLLHDGSQEVLELFPRSTSGANPTRRSSAKFKNAYGEFAGQEECEPARGAESGSAARFFQACAYAEEDERASRLIYCAKASRAERGEGNGHPTVKPVALMRYLIRLVCPPDGLVLDPFAGSGTTGVAAAAEGVRCVLIEREAEYCEIARRRLRA